MTDIVIRSFMPSAADGVSRLILPIQQGEFGIAIRAEDQPDLLDIPSFYQVGAGGFWVAERSGTVVGTIALKELESRQAALRKMFVASSVRGREQGVAARLLETLTMHAREAGLTAIYLGTTDAFKAAHRFYEKNDFVQIPRSDLPDDFPIVSVDTRFYRLSFT